MSVTDSIPAGLPLAGRIRAARDLRSKTQGEVIEAMDTKITVAALSQIEAGKVRPTTATLTDLAEALEVPVEFFYAQWPSGRPEDEPPTPFFRDLRSTPAKERRRALALALLLSDLVAAIEHHVRLPLLNIPSYPVDAKAGRQEIEAAAQQTRIEWGLGIEPIPHVVREIERHGVPVARLAIGHQSVDAFSVAFASRPLILLTDDKSSYVRSRFDAGHELAHLVLHSEHTEPEKVLERQAHAFASAFLLPTVVAREELPKRMDGQGWSKLAQLKRQWGISMAALLLRAKDLRLLTDDDYRTAMKYMSAKGWRAQEPGDRELGPPEAPLLLERSLKRIEVTEGLTPEQLIESAALPLADTIELVQSSHDRRPMIEL